MHKDRFDQPITTSSSRAVELYDAAVDLLFAMQPGSGPLIEEALTIDPDFALAHCAKARSLATVGNTREARRHAALGRDLAAPLTARERDHANIVSLVLHGESREALSAVREHAAAYPRDAVPLSFALGVYGLLGFGGFNDFHARQAELLESVAHAGATTGGSSQRSAGPWSRPGTPRGAFPCSTGQCSSTRTTPTPCTAAFTHTTKRARQPRENH